MTVYILKNGTTDSIIEICDEESNAEALKNNLLKTGQYKLINIVAFDILSDTIEPLSVVRIAGNYTKNTLTVYAYNPTSVVDDTLTFTVNPNDVTFTGLINLTEDEKAEDNIVNLKLRIREYVKEQFKERLEDNNPS